MERSAYITTLLCLLAISSSNGCDMSPPGTLWLPQSITIKDTFRGVMFSTETINIAGINSIVPTQTLNGGPYFAGSIQGSTFTLFTVDAFDDYEENETIVNPNLNILFNCVGGTTRSLTFIITITDTNNNVPQFIPTNELEFTVIPPLPPGYLITGCFHDITVKDIDLTTERIDFEIFDSPLFEISYDAASSTDPKEFRATLRTTTFIRSIPEPLEFQISATDVDQTGDPPHTVYASVRIKTLEGGFELPDEPVFTQAYYLATYTKDHELILDAKIALQQGYTDDVQFSLDQGTAQHFTIVKNGNDITLVVASPISSDLFVERQIRVVINAELENTSGANAVIIIELPEEEELKFAQPVYEGAIVDNVLQLSQLVLLQGYEGNNVSVEVLDYAEFFEIEREQNLITLTMTPLDANIIKENAFLNLRVVASTSLTSVLTVVTLEIVKDDTVTPVFGRAVYEGLYETTEGLDLEPIVLVQGYDETVEVNLQGEHVEYFTLDQSGPTINLKLDVPSLPTQLFSQQNLLLYLQATKPRTVGATTAISIALPAEIQLEFDQQYYNGIIEDNVLYLSELTLSKGYEGENVTATIKSSYASFFQAKVVELNKISLTMSPLEAETIEQNSFLNLEIIAASSRSSATTIVTLEIIKDDSVTPVFERVVYEGSYDFIDGLMLEEIMLIQGYDETVQFSLQGEHSGYFEIVRLGPHINLTVSSLPPEVFPEQNLILTIEATKPRTVGANAAISIALPEEIQLEFEQPSYIGFIEENQLQLTGLILSQGYDSDPVSVSIHGDYASYFDADIELNKITLSMSSLESEVIEENTFINLHVIASTNRSSAITIVTLEIIKNDTLTPVFERALYEGTYDPDDGLNLEDIVLVQGYDDTVKVFLDGEHAGFFQLDQQGPVISLTASTLPNSLLSKHSLLLTIEATKPGTVAASAAISIALPEARVLGFEAKTYSGTIRDNLLQMENIILSIGYTEDVVFTLTGDYASYFIVTNVQNQISLDLLEPVSDSVIKENNFLLLTLSASALNAVTATTTIAIDIIKEDQITPFFSQNIYYGTYTGPYSVNIDTISLSQGFDDKVSFELEGEHSQYFKTSVSVSGAVSLELQTAIPAEVIFNEKVLLFSILAEKELTVGARAAVAVNFPRELTEPSILRFSRNIYVGSLEQNVLKLEDVVLEMGYATGTQFDLLGDFSEYFTFTSNSNIVRISATAPLPSEILKSKFITLELEARRDMAVSVSTTIIIDIEQPEIVEPPVFAQAYYRGVYTLENELQFEDEITLAQGFDDTVSFTLDGASSQWFALNEDNDTISVTILDDIPKEVLEANHHLLFSIVAKKPNTPDGLVAISIDLPRETISDVVLGFNQISYTGSITNNELTLSPIALSEGPTTGVTFTLHGQLSDYFGVTSQGSNVIVVLENPIPAASIPSNRIIVLEIQASAPQAAPAYATIVFHVVVDDDTTPAVPDLVFDATYYVGSYTANGGLVLSTPITLAEGYGPDVEFSLEGDDSLWFTVTNSGSSITLVLATPIPPAVVASNHKLIFVLCAQRPGGEATRATIVISLTDGEPDGDQILGFNQLSYMGSIANNVATLSPIVLSEGPTTGVTFTLHGQLSDYFGVTSQGSNVIVVLENPIPAASIPSNRIIVLEIQASAPQAAPAYATIVFHVVVDDDTTPAVPDLVFDATYYVGSYTANGGLVLSTPITLAEGYGPDVEFSLEGDDSQWFTFTNSGSSITLVLATPIPPAVVASNHKLIFVLCAQRPGGEATRATIVISLTDGEPDGDQILGFNQLSYMGSIANNVATLSPIVLSEGPTTGVTFTLHGQLSDYFGVTSQGSNVIVVLENPIPAAYIPSNRIIVLEIQASAPQAAPAYATIVFHVVVDDDTTPAVPDLVFDATYYVGSYTANGGLVLSTPITLAEGYGPDVEFSLEGDDSQWFTFTNSGSSITLVLATPIPPAVVASNHKLIFVLCAQRPGGEATRATIVISLTDGEPDGDQILGFNQLSYMGSIANNVATLSPIVLSEGPTTGVTFTLHGQLSDYFGVTSQGSNVIVVLENPIPAAYIPSNRIIVLEIQASAPQAAPAYATIVFHVVVDDDTTPAVPDLVFDATYYVGSYTANGGLVLSTPITLAEGYGPDVEFSLEGDDSQWFTFTNSGCSITLVLATPIPPAVVASNHKLIFVLCAQRPGGEATRATIVISLTDGEPDGDQILGFNQLSYMGSIANNVATLSPIVLSEGPTTGVTFTLHGQLSDYFGVTSQGSNVIVVLENPIPAASIPSNRIIVLEIQASAPQAAPAYATIVFHVVVDDDTTPAVPDLVFDATYYVGSYTANGGLVLSTPITLAEGYGPDVEFSLEGDDSLWFTVTNSGSSITLVLATPIPPAVVASNHKLIFVLCAQRPGGEATRVTIVISLTDGEPDGDQILGFNQLSYMGSIANNVATLSPIVLSEGPTTGVTFTLHGQLSDYFGVTSQGSNVIVVLENPIPAASIPSNRIIVLEIQASAPQAAPAYATIVFHVVVDDDTTPAVPDLVFDATYYVGSYTANGGLVLSTPITLAEGYGPDVEFSLEGDDSQWFTFTNSGSSITLVLATPIPPAVVASNHKLIFVLCAQRPGGEATRATIVISLTDGEPDGDQILGFNQLSYMGSIANNVATLSPIVLSEGPTTGVTFTLHGQLSDYFGVTSQGSNVIVVLENPIPAASIPSNRIIVLEIQASAPQAAPAYATIVFHVVVDDDTTPAVPDLVFDATYYVGSYTANGGLVLSTPITLAEGYGPDVEFSLEGDDSQWFTFTNSGSSITLVLATPIAPAVVASNHKLIFVLCAQRPGGEATRATIVISLTDGEPDGDQILGFNQLSYMGSIANNVATLSPIVLSEGPTTGVTFTLHGQLSDYFGVTSQGSNVIVVLENPIPAAYIPSNRIIVLEIQASAPQAAPAYATIVFHVVVDDDTTPAVPDLVFDATYYVGSYTANGGLVLSTPITLAEGYGPDVEFSLEGDDSQWFTFTNSGSSITLVLATPIPPAVVASNHKLIFVLCAQRPGGEATRATIVISLTDGEPDGDQILGFNQLSYMGSIANNVATLSPIVLSEGPTTGVTFTLHGQLSDYFGVTSQGSNVIVVLENTIPAASIPSNRIIVLEIQASAPQAAPAYATIVFHVVVDDDTTPAVPDLVFDATYYVGSYTANGGLVLSTPITLAEGYGPDVEFSLEGDDSQWFTVTNSGSSVTLVLSTPIPPAVVADNQKLIFVIRAQRPGSEATQATIVISLTSDDNQDSSVSFDKVLYDGIIQGSEVHHEAITVVGYDGSDIHIIGVFSSEFKATLTGGTVVVQTAGPLTLPPDTHHVALELRVADTGAVLVLQVTATGEQPQPTVSFEQAYVFSVGNQYTGPLGLVCAAADNGEAVTYSLLVGNEHLQTRITVGSGGELTLSAPAETGIYNFQVIATTVFTQAIGQTTVQLTVEEAITGPIVCGDDDIVTAPLIIIDRDEEEEHKELVPLNASELPGCHYTLTNRWPIDQNWLYVDDSGLHTNAIDREDDRIAFMALSQVQVELNLVCDGDVIRNKRSLDNRLDWLGPYDYGTSKWILADTIPFNSRRSIVNLIVNDINDNDPIFVGIENEPIVVGYPIAELEETIMPRSLAELQATDADVGKNAELLYWSQDPEIAVSPTTGFVHVRTNAQLQNNMILTVNATDLNGEGRTGSINLMVKLLDTEHIAVVTVRDAFLEDESRILGNLSNAIGYEVKPLRSVVVSTSVEEETTRRKRDTTTTAGTSLEVYVYGLIQKEPVAVEKLSNDINSAAIVTVDIASILSLGDHLEGNEICAVPGRDAGLLAATIVLSILLFILIVAAVVWYLLTRKKRENYNQFSDANSLASQNESLGPTTKPAFVATPRLNIEELKRSERRLQDMLNAPIEELTVEPIPSSSNKDPVPETKIPLPDPLTPIVIQDKLKDASEDSDEDEFGEIKKSRRKSVVTFNENVEKIIHVNDEPDMISDPNHEVYKF